MPRRDCLSCQTIAGEVTPPGGVVYEGDHGLVFLDACPLLVAGQGFIVLKRHCEMLEELTDHELATLGPIMRHTSQAMTRVLQPARIHFGLYAESVRHIHWHVLPRMSDMPAGNIPVAIRLVWLRFWQRLGLKRLYTSEEVARIATRLRYEFEQLVKAD